MEQLQSSTGVAGVDIGKHWLDADLCEGGGHQRFSHTREGVAELIVWLKLSVCAASAWRLHRPP